MKNVLLSDFLDKIQPYAPGEQPDDRTLIKLNTNENPYPPSPEVLNALKEYDNDNLRLYPDPDCIKLKEVIAGYYRLSVDEIFIGNGSDEILSMSFLAFFKKKKPVLFSDVTYSFYKVCASLFEIPYKLVETDEDFNYEAGQFNIDNDGIILANPNAPTGKEISQDIIESILKNNTGNVVIVDEAYIDFGSVSSIPLIKKYKNLVIVQTLSKSRSLAGIRVGFAMGSRVLMEGLRKVKDCFNSYTVDRIAQECAKAALLDVDYFKKTSAKIIQTREWTTGALREIGFKVMESKANFVFASSNAMKASKLFEHLRNNGILVRYFNEKRIDNFLRISIGTDEEMKTLIDVLSRIV